MNTNYLLTEFFLLVTFIILATPLSLLSNSIESFLKSLLLSIGLSLRPTLALTPPSLRPLMRFSDA